MPLIKLNSAIFDEVETAAELPDVVLDFADDLAVLEDGITTGAPTVLQLSSSLIRLSQDMVAFVDGFPTEVTYEMRISGVGLKPVGSLHALMDAINDGLATGTLSKFAIFADGVEVLALTLRASGYVLTSGDQSVTLAGHLPLTFTQFFDLAGLFEQAVHLDSLTRAERLALFDDLAAYSVSGITVADDGATLFAVSMTATTASITINGLTLSATGSFPDNFGEDLSLLWEAVNNFKVTGDVGALATFTSADMALTSLKITNAAGVVLASVGNPLADTPPTWMVDGKAFDEVLVGDTNGDLIHGEGGLASSVLAGMGGDDALFGLRGTDWLFGGTGDDQLDGGAGSDLLDGGSGRDTLTGGTGGDIFVFNLGDGIDRISDFAAGADHIRILAAARLSDLTFTRMGHDVQIDFRTMHILVEDITIAELRQIDNFQF